jgi:hypothetical protein
MKGRGQNTYSEKWKMERLIISVFKNDLRIDVKDQNMKQIRNVTKINQNRKQIRNVIKSDVTKKSQKQVRINLKFDDTKKNQKQIRDENLTQKSFKCSCQKKYEWISVWKGPASPRILQILRKLPDKCISHLNWAWRPVRPAFRAFSPIDELVTEQSNTPKLAVQHTKKAVRKQNLRRSFFQHNETLKNSQAFWQHMEQQLSAQTDSFKAEQFSHQQLQQKETYHQTTTVRNEQQTVTQVKVSPQQAEEEQMALESTQQQEFLQVDELTELQPQSPKRSNHRCFDLRKNNNTFRVEWIDEIMKFDNKIHYHVKFEGYDSNLDEDYYLKSDFGHYTNLVRILATSVKLGKIRLNQVTDKNVVGHVRKLLASSSPHK